MKNKISLKHTDHEIKKNVLNISRLIGRLKVVELGIGNTKGVEILAGIPFFCKVNI
jgi:hypothetical protein